MNDFYFSYAGQWILTVSMSCYTLHDAELCSLYEKIGRCYSACGEKQINSFLSNRLTTVGKTRQIMNNFLLSQLKIKGKIVPIQFFPPSAIFTLNQHPSQSYFTHEKLSIFFYINLRTPGMYTASVLTLLG